MFITESLEASSKAKKYHLTNKVTQYFSSSLYAPRACTLIRTFISGLGLNIKSTYFVIQSLDDGVG